LTKEGWKQIETAWYLACNHEERDGSWYKKGTSVGDKVEGFAIDPVTKKSCCGTTYDHHWAHRKLYAELCTSEKDTSCTEIDDRIIDGWRGAILDFQVPCIFIANCRFFHEPDFLKEIERSILEQKLGLPLSSLFLEKLLH
jgi:hypothetical protein